MRRLVLLAVAAACAGAQERTMGLLLNDSAAFRGYTLFGPMPYTEAYLIDNEGRLVHSWPGTRRPGLSVSFTESGHLLRTMATGNTRFRAGGAGGRLELADWDGNVTWGFDYSDTLRCQHHDAIRMPNGNVMLIAWEYKSREEAIAAGRNPTKLYENCLWPDHLVELDPETDSVVWEWHVWDHLIQDYDSTKANYGAVGNHPELIDLNYIGISAFAYADWQHSNSVAYNPDLDQVLLSTRQFCEIWVIDHSTTSEQARGHTGGRYGRGGDLLYRWGTSRAYRHGAVGSRKLFGQHDAQWIGAGLPGAGHILIFNNGVNRPGGGYSSVDEIVPPESAGFYRMEADTTWGPAAATWLYAAPNPRSWYASLISGCERMENGNTLICDGVKGTFFEVTHDSTVAWKYINPVCDTGPMFQYEPVPAGSNQVFRIRRYAADYPGFNGRNLQPGLPIERYRQFVCEEPQPRADAFGLRVLPQPVQSGAFAGFSLPRAGMVTLGVYDAGGRLLQSAEQAARAGENRVALPVGGLSRGAYVVVLEAGGLRAAARFVRP